MGQAVSGEQTRSVSTEELAYELASKFAHRCFTPLELAHFRDNFRTLADEQDGIRYWKEDTLYKFLVIPDVLGPGPVMYQMTTYLGAFPFPSLAPSILTFEALVKVVVLMTERYEKVLRRGSRDRIKLLFRSLAVYDRQSGLKNIEGEAGRSVVEENDINKRKVDDADEELQDDDDLALAALESLDAIEVFKEDEKTDTKMHHAQIPADNFRRLLLLLLVMAPLGPQQNLANLAQNLSQDRIAGLRGVADSILWSFDVEKTTGISYGAFRRLIPRNLPHVFDSLNPLFEHFLFSKNMDLSRHRAASASPSASPVLSASLPPALPLPTPLDTEILDPATLSQLSFFLQPHTVFYRLHSLYSASDSGFSLNSISSKLFHWKAPTIMLVSGTSIPNPPATPSQRNFLSALPPPRLPRSPFANSSRLVFGAYLPVPWKATPKTPISSGEALLFQLSPFHDVFPSSSRYSLSSATFTPSLGISFGCPIPATATPHLSQPLGPVSLHIEPSLSFCVFTHDASSSPSSSFSPSMSAVKARRGDWQEVFEIESLEIWGVGGEEEESEMMKRRNWEEREAERRRGVNSTGDVEADRALLELAGLVGGEGNSGGSMD